MPSIATSLWDSIFTPGPTPILVKAMNISFFALFALLIPLVYYTHNIHVILLTILAIGLWAALQWYYLRYSINTGFWWSWRKKNNDQYRRKASNTNNTSCFANSGVSIESVSAQTSIVAGTLSAHFALAQRVPAVTC
jgi:hypothetical protein